MTLLLFVLYAVAVVAIWNRFFDAVPLRVAALFFVIVCAYEATTLFTPRVDVPAGIAADVYPWKADPHPAAPSNTGIIPTQIVPWTRVARDAIRSGEWPLWNRYSAAGSPLLANQQTAIFHPFTLAGFFLSIGKSFTLSVCLRLFTVLFFTYTFLRGNGIRQTAATFGALAYAFCTFHIVWLLFPLGLATMMLPVALSGIARRSFPLLTIGLAASALGGHPESAFWVWTVCAAYAVFLARGLWIVAAAFIAAAALTAFVWMPTVALLPDIERTSIMSSNALNPPNHSLSPEWIEMLIAPNLLGTSQTGTWSGPSRHQGAVLDDYGEMASGYAGIISLALAAYGAAFVRRREKWFFIALCVFSFLTIAEVPLWRDIIRAIPIVALTLHQRLRIVWLLGVVGLAALAIDAPPRPNAMRISAAIVWLTLVAVYVTSAPPASAAWLSFAIASAAIALFAAFPSRPAVAAAATLLELFAVTYRYNPSSAPADMMPSTGAIEAMKRRHDIGRMVVLGWSFLPDTPSYYGLEDVKTTDPVRSSAYKQLMHGFLRVGPSYDEVVGDVSEPFLDFLNIRSVYVPPDAASPLGFTLRYRGTDGSVYDNPAALPRYFVPARFCIRSELGAAIPRLKQIRDFAQEAIVDHLPIRVANAAPYLVPHSDDEWLTSAPALVSTLAYRNNSTRLQVVTQGWSLLVSSDAKWQGWRAYVDRARQPPVTVNGAFLGAFVPPGTHVVEFRYRPAAFDIGLRVSAAALLLIAIAAFTRRIW